jgi:hypothetical protein
MYAKITNNIIVDYPANPRLDNPYVSFPDNWGGGDIDGFEYAIVNATTPPSVNLGWSYSELTPVLEEDHWDQTWQPYLLPNPQIKQAVSNKRYDVEVGGVRIANNLYSTDRESQTKYVAVAVDISQQANIDTWSITWKTNDNQFVNLNANQMLQVIGGVRQHVQNCYDKEAEYYQLIDTANTSVLKSTDFSANWPSNE